MTTGACIVVAHENEAIRRVIETLLVGAGFSVRALAEGRACRDLLQAGHVAGLVLDVAISELLPIDLIDTARARSPRIPVVLVASIYNRTSYKRRPTSLYGADDYVEQHHIADALVDKLVALVGMPHPMTPRGANPASRATVQIAAEEPLSFEVPSPDAVQRAERLARIIVSDIALYNGDAVMRARLLGPDSRGADELEARLRLDLEEGRLLFDLRVPAAVRRARDFIGEALRELMVTDKVA